MAPVAEVAGQYRTFRTAPHRTAPHTRIGVPPRRAHETCGGLSVQSPFAHRRESAPQRPPSGASNDHGSPKHCTALHCTAIVGLGTRRRYTAVRPMRRQSVSRRRAVAGMSACTGDDPFGNTKQDLYTEVKGTYARPKHSTRVLVALIGHDRSL